MESGHIPRESPEGATQTLLPWRHPTFTLSAHKAIVSLATLLALAVAPALAAPRVVLRDDFESGTQGWVKWSTVDMTQSARGPAHWGKAALWGEIRQLGPLVHSRPGLDFPIAGSHLTFWYLVPTEATFDHFEINLRTHDFGDRMFQLSRGLKKGAWTRFDVDFRDFFDWSLRAFGSLRVKQFEITASGQGSLALDDVQVTLDDAEAAAAARVPWVIYAPGVDATAAQPGARVYFRKHVALAAVPRLAWLQVGGDEEATVWVNGKLLGKGGLSPATEFDLHGLLRAGDNVIAAELLNHGNAPNPSGFLAVLGTGDTGSDETVSVSDASWLTSTTPAEGWTAPDFADAAWRPAQQVVRVPGPPWGTVDIYPLRRPVPRAMPDMSASVQDGHVVVALTRRSAGPTTMPYWAHVRLADAGGAIVSQRAGVLDLTTGSARLDLALPAGLTGAVEFGLRFARSGLDTSRVLWLGDSGKPLCDRTSATRVAATGIFRTERIGDRWFLVDAAGSLFHTISCNAVMEAPYWSLAYHNRVAERYTDVDAWRKVALQRLLNLGFNSLCGGPLDPPRRANVPYFAGRCLTWAGPRLRDANGGTAMFPDVFDPAWQHGAEAWVREDTAKYRDDPLLIGYFTDNEIQMHQPLSPGQGVMGYFWSHFTAAELARWLSERYHGDIGALNRRWSSPAHQYAYGSFADLAQDKPTIRSGTDPVAPDLNDFVRHIIKTYVDTIVGLYRKYDPHHLVCTNRFAGQFDVQFADLLKPYDIIACNSYPRSHWGQTRFDEGQLTWLRQLHKITGRPVLITEWGVTAVDAGLPSYWGRLDTQAQRAEAYRNVLQQLWDEKYIVGAHWFSWGDSTDAEASNWGLVKPDDEYYQPLANTMQQVNTQYSRRVQTWHP